MEKNTRFENKKKKFISLVIGLVISVVVICFIFIKNYSRIYELLLNKDMEQIELHLILLQSLYKQKSKIFYRDWKPGKKFSWTIMQEKKMRL